MTKIKTNPGKAVKYRHKWNVAEMRYITLLVCPRKSEHRLSMVIKSYSVNPQQRKVALRMRHLKLQTWENSPHWTVTDRILGMLPEKQKKGSGENKTAPRELPCKFPRDTDSSDRNRIKFICFHWLHNSQVNTEIFSRKCVRTNWVLHLEVKEYWIRSWFYIKN